MSVLKTIARKYTDTSLIIRIIIGLIIGAILGMFFKNAAAISILGDLFVGALKAIAPILVFVIVIAALCQGSSKLDRRFGTVIALYLHGRSCRSYRKLRIPADHQVCTGLPRRQCRQRIR